jgi:alpha-L-fucosidase
MKYAVLTAKHHEGFCLWDTAQTDFKATRSPAGRDLLRPYVDAFRAEGLKVGFYYSLLDWHHPQYTIDIHHPLRDLPADSPIRKERSLPAYVDYMHAQVRELLTGYGKIDILWFDFSFDDKRGEAWRAKDLVAMVRELQPHILMNNRLTGSHEASNLGGDYGEINTPEQMIPAEGLTDTAGNPVVWESCITLNDHWGYNRDDRNFKSAAEVIRMLVESVSKGGNLLLNVGPTAKGEFQPEAQNILSQVASWMRVNGESVIGAGRAVGMNKPDWGRYTKNGNTVYAHVYERPTGPILFENLGAGADGVAKVKRARYLADGSELIINKPWNVPQNSPHLFVNLPRTPLPDAVDTVIALELT